MSFIQNSHPIHSISEISDEIIQFKVNSLRVISVHLDSHKATVRENEWKLIKNNLNG